MGYYVDSKYDPTQYMGRAERRKAQRKQRIEQKKQVSQRLKEYEPKEQK